MSTAALPPKQFTTVDGHRLAHVETVAGLHFIQEDSGAAIGDAVAAWLSELG